MRSFKELIEARKPSDDNFGGAGYSGERGFKNKAAASRGGSTAGRNRSRAAQRKAQQGMIDAAIKQDKKEFRKHAVAMSKSISSMTRQKEPIQNMWSKEKAKALKDGTWFKMSIAQQKKIEGDKPRYEPFDWSRTEAVSEAVSPAQQAAIAISKKERAKKKLKEEDPCWDGWKQVGMKMKNGKRVPNCVKKEDLEGIDYCVNCGDILFAEALDENLKKWFKEKWVRFGPDGKIRGDCARGSSSEGKPKCLPQSKAHALGKKGRATAASRKRREDPSKNRRGKAKNVKTK